ncbi:MAG: TetR/AcrR family transcriptional regulator [Bacilli bacterium]
MKEKFHHGDLRSDLIRQGLVVLNDEGLENLSLRKVAKLCGVSHTAPYKHFENKEALVQAISDEVRDRFVAALQKAVDQYPGRPYEQVGALGAYYVTFMVENPDYMKFLFLNSSIETICYADGQFLKSEEMAFEIFKNCAEAMFREAGLPPAVYGMNVLTMWSVVHGYALLVAKKNLDVGEDYVGVLMQMLTSRVRVDVDNC